MPYRRVSKEPREDVDPKHPRDPREKENPNPKVEWTKDEELSLIRFSHFQLKNHNPALCTNDKCEGSIKNICFWRGEPDDENPGEFKQLIIPGVTKRKAAAYRARAKTLTIPSKERPFMVNETSAAAEKVCTVFFAKTPPPPKKKIKINVVKNKPNPKVDKKKKVNKNDKVLPIEEFLSNIEEIDNPPEVDEPLTRFNFSFRTNDSSSLELASIETETENSFAVPQLELRQSDSSLLVNPFVNETLENIETAEDTWGITHNILNNNVMDSDSDSDIDRSSSIDIPEVGKSMPII